MGCNLSARTVNCIETRRNDIIEMKDIKDQIQLVKFIKLPSISTQKGKNKKGNFVWSQASSYRSTRSKDWLNSGKAHQGPLEKRFNYESKTSMTLSDLHSTSNEKVYDHQHFLELEPQARLISVSVYGYNYITAIETKYAVPGREDWYVFLHSGTAHDHAKKNEMHCETINILNYEYIVGVNCCVSAENHRIRSISFTTNYEQWLIMEGEVELKHIIDVSDSLDEISKIENDSINSESAAHPSFDDEVEREIHEWGELGSNIPSQNKINNFMKQNKNIAKNSTRVRPKNAKLDKFKHQILDLQVYGRHIIGFRSVFGEYLEDFEVYSAVTGNS